MTVFCPRVYLKVCSLDFQNEQYLNRLRLGSCVAAFNNTEMVIVLMTLQYDVTTWIVAVVIVWMRRVSV